MGKRARGCAFGLLIGTVMRTFILVIEFLARILAKILLLFGLWIPLIYAIFGVILYYMFDFNPFDFSLYSTIYLSGAAACVVACLIISVRNIVVRPARSVYEGYKHPLWERGREKKIEQEQAEFAEYVIEKRGESLTPSQIEDYSSKRYKKKSLDFLVPSDELGLEAESQNYQGLQQPANNFAYNVDFNDNIKYLHEPSLTAPVKSEKPQVYFSKLEPELLVHEYGDRFELFRIENRRSVLDRVEYKE